ncbi:unnamed protein product [Bathycoccus prasinos]
MRMLEKELEPYSKVLTQAATTIIDSDVSKYPIFVVHQHQMDMGILLIDKEQFKGNWSVNASSLEEFVTKNIIEQDKIDGFIDKHERYYSGRWFGDEVIPSDNGCKVNN